MWPELRTSIIANVGSLFFGVTLAWSSIVGPQIVENESYAFWISKKQFGMVVSAMSLGAAISCVISGMVRHSIGTRYTIFIFSQFATFGSILITIPQNLLMMIVGRFCIGISIGSYSFLIPIYVGEVSSREHRGTMLGGFQIMLNFGILAPYILGYFASVNTFNIVCGSIPLFYSIAFLALPESPVFLMSKGRQQQTQFAMLALRGKDCDFQSEIVKLRDDEQRRETESSFLKLMQIKSVRKASIIIMFQFFCFQMSGGNAVTFYAQQIVIDARIKIEPILATIILSTFQFLAAVAAVRYINRHGRKLMICTFNVFVSASLIALGSYFMLKDLNHSSVGHLSWLPLLSMCVYLIAFCLGMAPVTYIWLGELFTQTSAKRVIAPLGQMVNHSLTFVIGLLFPLLTDLIGCGYLFFAFAVINVTNILFVIVFIPETNGRSSDEIQNALSR